MLASFDGDSLTFDSLQANPSFYYDPTPIGKVFARSHLNDTDYIDFSLDTGVVRKWFTSLADSVNNGMLLVPTNSNVIKGFYTFNSYDSTLVPRLTVTYRDTINDTIKVLTFEDTTSNSRYLAYLDSTSLNKDRRMLYVLSGVPYRGVMTFDVSRLPSPCVINSSTLQLAQNRQLTKLSGYMPDSLISTQINDDGSVGTTFSTGINVIDSSGTPAPHIRYQFDTRPQMQSWVEKYLKQPRMEIIGINEASSFDLHVMYGDSAIAKELCPRIIVTYSTKVH